MLSRLRCGYITGVTVSTGLLATTNIYSGIRECNKKYRGKSISNYTDIVAKSVVKSFFLSTIFPIVYLCAWDDRKTGLYKQFFVYNWRNTQDYANLMYPRGEDEEV